MKKSDDSSQLRDRFSQMWRLFVDQVTHLVLYRIVKRLNHEMLKPNSNCTKWFHLLQIKKSVMVLNELRMILSVDNYTQERGDMYIEVFCQQEDSSMREMVERWTLSFSRGVHLTSKSKMSKSRKSPEGYVQGVVFSRAVFSYISSILPDVVSEQFPEQDSVVPRKLSYCIKRGEVVEIGTKEQVYTEFNFPPIRFPRMNSLLKLSVLHKKIQFQQDKPQIVEKECPKPVQCPLPSKPQIHTPSAPVTPPMTQRHEECVSYDCEETTTRRSELECLRCEVSELKEQVSILTQENKRLINDICGYYKLSTDATSRMSKSLHTTQLYKSMPPNNNIVNRSQEQDHPLQEHR